MVIPRLNIEPSKGFLFLICIFFFWINVPHLTALSGNGTHLKLLNPSLRGIGLDLFDNFLKNVHPLLFFSFFIQVVQIKVKNPTYLLYNGVGNIKISPLN